MSEPTTFRETAALVINNKGIAAVRHWLLFTEGEGISPRLEANTLECIAYFLGGAGFTEEEMKVAQNG